MSILFEYSNLTWPEVAALERDTPLVIPLEGNYPLKEVGSMLARPERVGFLPAIPYGWHGSGLEVPALLLDTLLDNLLSSLRDQGFTHVYVLSPPGTGLTLPGLIALQPNNSHTTKNLWPLPGEAHNKVVIIPTGQTEQHGHHLPLSVDTLLIEAVCQGTVNAVPEKALSLPVFPYGVSTHATSFAGTLNCGGRAFEDFWLAILDELVQRGFETFYLLSGHGGNCSFLTNVVKYAGERHKHIFCATAWLYLSGPKGLAALQQKRCSPIGGMGHACELETALMLHLRPDLVHMNRVIDETDFISTPSYYMDWVEGGALIANPPWEDDTVTGAYGAGSLADAENGRFWLTVAIKEKVDHVNEILEQHHRRSQKRRAGVNTGNSKPGVGD